MKNGVQLIAYADRLGGSLAGLGELLAGPLSGLFSGLHILPFFDRIDGADAGFDPVDHTRVDARIGGWDDLKTLSRHVDLMADVIVNHVSAGSPQFRDFLTNGDASRYAGMFLTLDRVFPEGAAEEDLVAIYRPRPGLPFSLMKFADGSRRLLWTTFTPEQIDIDVTDPRSEEYLESILDVLSSNGVTAIRLDAVGYAIKKAGTACFMIDETFAFISRLAGRAAAFGLEVLVEVHAYYRRQIEIARRVDWVYDFALPPLVLHAFFEGTSRCLKHWIDIRPANAVTVLDTHDGIGIIDIGAADDDPAANPGLVPDDELDRLVSRIHRNSNGESELATGAAADNLDLYQVNCTLYDALGRDDRKFLLARAIQCFVPGVPQVYYVGLLAGSNDMQLLARSHVGRDINRHYYTRAEIEAAVERPVVQRQCELIRLRNTHAAFAGRFRRNESDDRHLALRWENGGEFAQLSIDLATLDYRLDFSAADGTAGLDLG